MNLSYPRYTNFFRHILLQIAVGLGISIILCPKCIFSIREEWPHFAFNISITFLLWTGNGISQEYLSRLIPWIKYPMKRLIWGMFAMIIYTSIIIVLLSYLFNYIYYQPTPFLQYIRDISPHYFYIGLIITTFIAAILHGRMFLIYWRQAAIEVEKLKREQLASQYRSLKDQLNPHFLFNSLNTLTAIVHKDPDQAVIFIKHLSSIYRYGLENADQEVISLDKEMDFIHSYIHLLQIRFRQNLILHIDVQKHSNFILPPHSLQLLVENVIKHNVISSSQPLQLFIYTTENNEIVVKNTLQRKLEVSDSIGIGLENIRQRYKHLTDKKIDIVEDEEYFTVTLPLITVSHSDSNESMVESQLIQK